MSISKKMKNVVFSLIPLMAILICAEIFLRIFHLDSSPLFNVGLPEEDYGLARQDSQLFWSLQPGFKGVVEGVDVSINRLGQRSEEISDKQPGEFRILSLGESTTFGVKVGQQQTYTAVLERLLNKEFSTKRFRAINAGVFAYSSFQSLKYLQLRGLELKPDLILFYHEVNDYLPSTLRNSSGNEIGALKTDQQLFESNTNRLLNEIENISAIYRFLLDWRLKFLIHNYKSGQSNNPLIEVGLPDIGIPPRLREFKNGQIQEIPVDERMLGRRVSTSERWDNLSKLVALCKEHKIRLIIIHPAYAYTRQHECLLTRFCKENNVRSLDSFPSLHPIGETAESTFLDLWHPNARGHERLAQALSSFIVENGLLNQN